MKKTNAMLGKGMAFAFSATRIDAFRFAVLNCPPGRLGKEAGVYIQRGQFRTVIVMSEHGVVIKMPRVMIKELIWELIRRIAYDLWHGKHGLRILYRQMFVWSCDTMWSGRGYLFKGLRDNWREWRFWRRNQIAILAPTRMWLGWTIQTYAVPLTIDRLEFVARIRVLLGDAHDSHHFRNPANFGFIDGRFVAVDYASPKVQETLLAKGEELARAFDCANS